jgi:phage terminase large subunit
MPDAEVPYNFQPRAYQRPVWDYMLAGEPGYRKRAALMWHRRAGKDKTVWNWLIYAASMLRTGTYYYFFPTYAQGKKIIWDGMDREGFPFQNHVPKELIVGRNETEMQLKVRNVSGGTSVIQIIGTDRMDSIVGTNPVGCIFSEYSLMNPRAWDLTRPILRENDGWAVFIFTPRGRNHAFRLFNSVRSRSNWFTQILTVRDTFREDGTPLVSDADIDSERAEGMDEDLLQQEYFCSFSGGVQGSYYAKQIDLAYKDGRVRDVPWEPILDVDTWWDIGVGDATAIAFVQSVHNERRLIDYLEAQGEGLPYYVRELRARPYVYGRHVMPHDIGVREFTSGIARKEAAEKLGIRPIIVATKLPVDDGIDAVRRMLPMCYFDVAKCADQKFFGHSLLDSLVSYHKDYDEAAQVYKNSPTHDWSSHGADMMRTGAVGWRPRPKVVQQTRVDMDFNPLEYGVPVGQAETDFDVL